jgi:uncharacterized coiled-coil DUF342 family protein
MPRIPTKDFDRSQLLEEIAELKKKLSKKRTDLITTKSRLANCREKMQKMKVTILYQRTRIVQLYKGQSESQAGNIPTA